jgi:hypothetical protein
MLAALPQETNTDTNTETRPKAPTRKPAHLSSIPLRHKPKPHRPWLPAASRPARAPHPHPPDG